MKLNIWKYTIEIHRRHPLHNVVQDDAIADKFDIAPVELVDKEINLHVPVAVVAAPERQYSRWQRVKVDLGIIAEEAFHVFLITYLFLLLVETIKPDFVSYFFNLNILLGVVLATGIVMAICTEEKEAVVTQDVSVHWKYIATISIAGALLIYYKTEDLRWLSIVLTVLTGGIIFLLSYIISVDSKEYS
jgi:hypothetical protein